MAVCDVYEPNLRRGLAAANTGAASYADYRKLLEDKSIEAVVIATPDHWHVRMAIDAVDAGKDVYLEKPLAHTIDDGFALVSAVRRTRRILQVGTQRRSAELFQRARQYASPAELGDIRLVTSQWLNRQTGLNRQSLEGPLAWKQWLGSAPARDIDPLRFFNLVLLLGLLGRAARRPGSAHRRYHPVVHGIARALGSDVHRRSRESRRGGGAGDGEPRD